MNKTLTRSLQAGTAVAAVGAVILGGSMWGLNFKAQQDHLAAEKANAAHVAAVIQSEVSPATSGAVVDAANTALANQEAAQAAAALAAQQAAAAAAAQQAAQQAAAQQAAAKKTTTTTSTRTATKTTTRSTTNTTATQAPSGPIKCPAGSQAVSGDAGNDTSCLPVICFTIVLPDPNHPECNTPFKP